MNLQEVGCGGMDCFDLAQNRDGCLALVNFRVPYNGGVSRPAENRLASQEGHCCMEKVSVWADVEFLSIVTTGS